MTIEPTPIPPTRRRYRRQPPIETGLKGKCPQCGQGQLFAGFLKFTDICAACGADFRTEDTGDGPAVFVILIAGAVIMPLALAFQYIAHAPTWLVLLIWGPVLILFCLGLLRLLRGVMFNLAWVHKAREITAKDVKPKPVKLDTVQSNKTDGENAS